jgi:hypothetical protein
MMAGEEAIVGQAEVRIVCPSDQKGVGLIKLKDPALVGPG